MATIIDGIAASENIDSSGERLSIKGMDISSLPIDGTCNFEHKSDLPSQTVGKILTAKKIFSLEDCDTERQKYYWDKIETPYIYITAELFDDYQESAKEIAAMFKYDAANNHERNVMNFSVEGHKIEKKGMDVTRSIARKVTITVTPCNKAAIAEMIPHKEMHKDEMDSLFKSETSFEIEIVPAMPTIEEILAKHDPIKHATALGIEPMEKNDKIEAKSEGKPEAKKVNPADPALSRLATPKAREPLNAGRKLGTTSKGTDIHSHKKIHEYGSMHSGEHREAANFHMAASNKSPDVNLKNHHYEKAKLHSQAAETASRRENKLNPNNSNRLIAKSMDAGSGMAAPSQLSQGAALQKESLEKKKKRLAKAKAAYETWEKKEEFESFMKSKLPHLTKGEIQAIGQAVALKKSSKERGIHQSDTEPSEKGHRPGVSAMGRMVRENDSRYAKIAVKNKISQSKEIKPNLPKSEK